MTACLYWSYAENFVYFSGGVYFGQFILVFFLHVFLKLIVALMACRRFSIDRRDGALELLLVTPFPTEKIVQGQVRYLMRQLRLPVVAVLILNIVMWTHLQILPPIISLISFAPQLLLGGSVTLLLDVFALGWMGMWRGLAAENFSKAVAGTLMRVMILPWLWLFFLVFMSILGGVDPDSFEGRYWAYFAFSTLCSLIALGAARRKLKTEFRRSVAEGLTLRPLRKLPASRKLPPPLATV
jgi:hypothetical protein